jgi:mismatch-specific thymine-DNA glycosylase
LHPEHDRALLRFGIGFTDAAKRPSVRATDLAPADWEEGAIALAETLRRVQPRVACFQTRTGCTAFLQSVLGVRGRPVLGLQPEHFGRTSLFLVLSPSGANAHTSIAIQTGWYDAVHDYLQGTVG